VVTGRRGYARTLDPPAQFHLPAGATRFKMAPDGKVEVRGRPSLRDASA